MPVKTIKKMLTLKLLREQPDFVIERLKVKNFDASAIVARVLDLDRERRSLQGGLDANLAQQKSLSAQIGGLMKDGKKAGAEAVKAQVADLKSKSGDLQAAFDKAEKEMNDQIVLLPNLPYKLVPCGKDSSENLVVKMGGPEVKLPENALPHWELAKKYNIIDFDLGVKITGAGFPVYIGQGAKLQRSLVQFFLDRNTADGYIEVEPPFMVNEASGFGTGQIPDKEDQMYFMNLDKFYMIPTAEVPVTNIYRDEILAMSEFPIKMTAFTQCFRREAGSYGKDVRGLNRLHQFDKVECVWLSLPENSYAALDSMNYSLSNNEIFDGLNQSNTYSYDDGVNVSDSSIVNQQYNSNAKAYSVNARITYNEPLGHNFFIQGNYAYGYSYNTSKKVTNDWNAATGKYDTYNATYSNEIDNTGINQTIGLNLMKQEEKYNLTIGAAARPSRLINHTSYGDKSVDIDTLRWNFSPEARFDYDFSDYEGMRIRYRGNTTQPSVTQLQPVEDNSNPTFITRGNPDLVPTFSHNLTSMYNFTNMQSFTSFNANLDLTYNVNSIVNGSWYSNSGVQYTVPLNNDEGTFSAGARLMFNTPIAKSKFSLMMFTFLNYSKSLSYIGNNSIDGNDPASYLNLANYTINHYQSIGAMGNLRGVYRSDIIELSLGGRVSYNQAWYDQTNSNKKPSFTDGITASVNATPGT